MLTAEERTPESAQRGRCYDCFRPERDCFCATIPTVENQTDVLIVQHRRERFHPFNTARIVRKALKKSQLLVDQTKSLAARLTLQPRAGLLYPGDDATLLTDVPPEQRPDQLVIVDGTWHHAKTLVRDIPALGNLPRYRLAPASPSRYRIRREPSAMALSTVEAIVAALRLLEPNTLGLDELLGAFLGMVDRQLAHPKSEHGGRRHERRRRTYRNIPLALLGNLDQVVVAYGESVSREHRSQRHPPAPLYWVAQRLGTGERFACAIRPDTPLQDALLGHLELTREDFSHALSLADVRASWAAFQRPGDIVAVYNQGVARLLEQISGISVPCLVLKSADFDRERRYRTLDELMHGEGIPVAAPEHPGRAGKRLANAVAFVRHLHALASAAASSR
jgi:DTW domain-containing protein YfiP